jgi:hypothetical protein
MWGLQKGDHAILFDFASGYDTARSRNLLCQEALEPHYDFSHILFMDDDCILRPDTLLTLLAAEKPIVCGWTRHKSQWSQSNIYRQGEKKDFESYTAAEVELLQEPFICKGAGFHCVLIHLDVLRTMNTQTPFKHILYDDGSELSEDLYFCLEAARLGFPVWCVPKARTGHWVWTVV